MSTSTTTAMSAPARQRNQRLALAGAATAALTAGALALANFGDPSEHGGAGEYAGGLGLSLVVLALLLGVLARRVAGDAGRTRRAALWCSGIGLVSVVVFWTGLPFVLGAAGMLLGHEAGGRGGTTAVTAGGLAVALGIVGSIIG